ncbi:uncharacterized protein EURHEDRAFT_412783 [Aspergillus ruber CBS 135680]|uniref:Uncharacterized protein n=1 Tax=Aspergillus ruber (strain CBS 135680) TaxID=1388766 RepID=A0A017SDA3_ASPRC|nr:uncharacterized protein EURHEDRAFT_412783 [Aspergillus ruber CBS 135680]EYE94932.1 hypothetical protein EURHEDRAFT_412783 [Aspergillus ruber CBS 135680]
MVLHGASTPASLSSAPFPLSLLSVLSSSSLLSLPLILLSPPSPHHHHYRQLRIDRRTMSPSPRSTSLDYQPRQIFASS